MLISEPTLRAALKTLHEAPPLLHVATYEARKAEGMLRAVKALEMKRYNQMPAVKAECEAYASAAYKDALDQDASASAALIQLKASIDAAKTIVDVWRTEKATERASFN